MRTGRTLAVAVGLLLAPAAPAQTPSVPFNAATCRELVQGSAGDGASLYRAGLCFEAAGDRVSAVNTYRQVPAQFQPALVAARLAAIFLVTGQPERLSQVRHSTVRDCAAQRHDMDFWIGDWETQTPGQSARTVSVHPVLHGCALLESVTNLQGGRDWSLIYFDPVIGQWRLSRWAAPHDPFEGSGEFRDGVAFFLSKGRTLIRRTLTPMAPHRVRETEEISSDGGNNWSVILDFAYDHKK